MSKYQLWQANWIWHEKSPNTVIEGEHERVYFWRSFYVLDAQSTKLVIHVSADSRYRLYLNGKSVSIGPCKGDRFTHYYETVDVTDYLIAGTNMFSAMVLHFTASEPFTVGAGGPTSIWRANTGAFFLEGVLSDIDGSASIRLDSDEKWLCWKDRALSFYPGENVMYIGGFERVDGSLLQHGWTEVHYDDSLWKPAVITLMTRLTDSLRLGFLRQDQFLHCLKRNGHLEKSYGKKAKVKVIRKFFSA